VINIVIGFVAGAILTAVYGLLCWAAAEAAARRTEQEDPP
jgi:type IV secretory pathway TrbD component